MKLNKIGKLYKVNSENKFINNKDKDLSELLINLTNVCLEYIKLCMNNDYLSVYLRGSCLELDVNDKSIFDLDIIVVGEDSQKDFDVMNDQYREKIINKMNKLYGFSIYPDVVYYSKPLWFDHPIHRFLSKKIDGSEDLSITSLDINKVLLFYKKNIGSEYITFLNMIKNKENPQKIIKGFYRSFGGLELLKNGMFSKSIYYCYNALMKKYTQHSDSLQELLYLFLNPEECDNLDKFEETIISIARNYIHITFLTLRS